MSFKKKKIGITGASGVLGSHLTKNLIKKYTLKKFNGDITKKNEVSNWIRNSKFDIIIHLAAIVPVNIVNSQKRLARKVNYLGTKLIVEELKKLKRKPWFLFASTSHVYAYSNNKINETRQARPISYYGKTKKLAEDYLLKQSNNLKICIARIFSFTSPDQKKNFFIPQVHEKINNNSDNNIFLNNTKHYRDFVSLEDICSAILLLIKSEYVGIINICSAKKISLKSVVHLINYRRKKIHFFDNRKSTCLVGSNAKLKKLGWVCKDSIAKIIKKYINI